MNFDSIFEFYYSVFFYALLLVSYLFSAIVEWNIFKKAGEPGWKTLIPFYNIFVSHHIAGMRHIWFVLEMAVWMVETVLELVPGIPDWIENPFTVITFLFTLISEIVHISMLGDRFGKKTPFKVGMVLLPIVFLPILAFGPAKYQAPEKHA